VASAVYMALLGPEGLRELGKAIMSKANYAMKLLSKIDGIRVPVFKSAHFKEFTVNFVRTGLTLQEISERLLQHEVHGGKDISKEFPELRKTALYCVTEVHSKEDIDRLADALARIMERR
jgi:glycine dehydrogenase subunit 1